MSTKLTKLRSIHHNGGLENIDPSSTLPHEESSIEITTDKIDVNQTLSSDEISLTESYRFEQNVAQTIEIEVSGSVSSTDYAKFSEEAVDISNSESSTKETYNNETIFRINDHAFEESLKYVPEVEKLMNAVSPEDQHYIVECNLMLAGSY